MVSGFLALFPVVLHVPLVAELITNRASSRLWHGDHAIDVMVTSRSFDVRQRFTDVGGVRGLSSATGMLTREQAAASRNLLLPVCVYRRRGSSLPSQNSRSFAWR